jgi:hypothetical protein
MYIFRLPCCKDQSLSDFGVPPKAVVEDVKEQCFAACGGRMGWTLFSWHVSCSQSLKNSLQVAFNREGGHRNGSHHFLGIKGNLLSFRIVYLSPIK